MSASCQKAARSSRSKLRAAIFWSSVAFLTLIYALLLPLLALPRRLVLAITMSYVAIVLWLLRKIMGLTWSVERRTFPREGAVLVAAKHQSAFETLILQHELHDPVIILKRELLTIPLFGWVLRRIGHIGVDRSGDLKGTQELLRAAKDAIRQGRPVLIFPEGSRRDVGAPPDYKSGVDLLYGVLKAPCVPVAVNSGRVWPAKALSPNPGRITVEFLPAIEPGLPRAEFARRLAHDIEAATARLLQLPM